MLLGIAAPLLLRRGHVADPSGRREAWGAVLVLLGGVCLRTLAVVPVEVL